MCTDLEICVARGGDSGRGDFIRDMGDWTRKGPLEPAAPPRRNDFGDRRGPSDFGERRASRDGPPPEGKAARDLAWERRGPLAPLPQEEGGPGSRDGSRPAPEGMGERSDSYRGGRRASPATWGEGRPEGSQGPPARREYAERPEKPERAPTAAEKDSQWRDRMRPDAPAQTSTPTSPVSPAAAPAAPGGRPRLNLAKRTVAEPADTPASATDSKASPFGAARPIDTATREKQVEEKRQQAIREKREADEKAKEERRLAKEAAAKAEEEAAANPPAAEATEEAPKTEEAAAAPAAEEAAAPNGATEEQKVPIRTREQQAPRDAPKPRGFDAGNWRSAGGERGGRGGSRGGPRGGGRGGYRNNENRGSRSSNGPGPQGGPASPAGESAEPAATQDEDGWTTVPKGRKGRA